MPLCLLKPSLSPGTPPCIRPLACDFTQDEALDESAEEWQEESDDAPLSPADREAMGQEIAELRRYESLATRIRDNAKGLALLTDVHEPWQAEKAGAVVDVLQIPAFLCRQTDLLISAAHTGLPINIKKGQFLSPWDMKAAIGKVTSTGNQRIILTERGTSFGYNNLVVDIRSIAIMKGFGFPVVFDATHSVQLPGGSGTCSGGEREFVGHLARAAIAAGANGLFMEVHPNPDCALCDGPNSIPLESVSPLLSLLKDIHGLVRSQS